MTVTALLASLLLFTPAEAGRRDNPPDVVEDALAYALTDRSKAVALLDEALKTNKNVKERRVIALHSAEQHRLLGELTSARPLFKWVRDNSEDPLQNAGRVGMALLTSANQNRAVPALWDLPEKGALDTQNADRYFWMTVMATQQNDPNKVREFTKKALAFAKSDPAVRDRIQRDLAALAGGEPAPEPESGTAMERAVTAFEKGDAMRAAELAQKAAATLEEGSFERLQAEYLAKRAQANRPVDPNIIAVLLPLSEKYEVVGNQVREAFEYGFRQGGGNRKLVFIDTGGTPEGAVAALENAVLDQGAVGVVGPLLSDSTEAVVRASAALEVPLVSISQSNESAEYEWVFQGVPSIGDQVHALLDHALLKKSFKKFAIFAPDSKYGHRAADAFRSEATSRGGMITSEVFYDPKANALMEFASKLGKKNYAERQVELNRLRDEAEANGKSRLDVVLPPAVEFDAIFLPDNASKVPIACAALAFEEFAIGEFRPRGRRAVPMMGLSGWNNPSLVGAGGEYVRHSFFPDSFYKPRTRDFSNAYKASTGRTPSTLEAVTADAGLLVGSASLGDVRDRATFRDALGAVKVDGAATRTEGFDNETRRTTAKMHILTITRSGLHPVGKPPPPPKDP